MTDIITGDRLLLTILNLSFNGTVVIAAVLALRWLMVTFMKDVPRRYIVWLWTVPFFRLLCPLDLSQWLGRFSLLRWNSRPLSVVNGRGFSGAAYEGIHPQLDTGWIPVDQLFNDAVTGSLPAPNDAASIDPFQIAQFLLFVVWAAVAAALVLWTVISYLKLRRRLSDAVLYQGAGHSKQIRIYESDRITTAFVVGWIRHKIFLPAGLSEEEADCVLLHEYAHIQRRDPLWKLAAWTALVIHWFNPLVWLAYRILIRDMEMACDERAIDQKLGQSEDEALRKQVAASYSKALLKLSMRGSGLLTPMAFGEGRVKERISGVLAAKKPRRVVCIAAVVLVAVAAVALSSNNDRDGEWIVLGGGSETVETYVMEAKGQYSAEEYHLAIDLMINRMETLQGTEYGQDEETLQESEQMLDLVMAQDWGPDVSPDVLHMTWQGSPSKAKLQLELEEGLTSLTARLDYGKIASGAWLLLSQIKDLEEIRIEVGVDTGAEFAPIFAGAYAREYVEQHNAEALANIVDIAEGLDPALAGKVEPTLWSIGGENETLLLLIRSLAVARGEIEDDYFGSARDPGNANTLPGVVVTSAVDENGNKVMLASAATRKLTDYMQNLPYEISQAELMEEGFVTELFGIINDNRPRWELFMSRNCENYPAAGMPWPSDYEIYFGSGNGTQNAGGSEVTDDENGQPLTWNLPMMGVEPKSNAGGMFGDEVLLFAQTTREGQWILTGVLAYEEGFVVVRDISRDEYRDSTAAEYSVRTFEKLYYVEASGTPLAGDPDGGTTRFQIYFADEGSDVTWTLLEGSR